MASLVFQSCLGTAIGQSRSWRESKECCLVLSSPTTTMTGLNVAVFGGDAYTAPLYTSPGHLLHGVCG